MCLVPYRPLSETPSFKVVSATRKLGKTCRKKGKIGVVRDRLEGFTLRRNVYRSNRNRSWFGYCRCVLLAAKSFDRVGNHRGFPFVGLRHLFRCDSTIECLAPVSDPTLPARGPARSGAPTALRVETQWPGRPCYRLND
jgi:hypothetical protein